MIVIPIVVELRHYVVFHTPPSRRYADIDIERFYVMLDAAVHDAIRLMFADADADEQESMSPIC